MTTKTFDQILQGMLDRVPSTMDKREGSVIYDALAPAARELADAYAELEQARADTFAGTAQREWLIKRGQEIGISPYEATYAIRRGQFTPTSLEIAIGERFSLEEVNFRVTERVEAGLYNLECASYPSTTSRGSKRRRCFLRSLCTAKRKRRPRISDSAISTRCRP